MGDNSIWEFRPKSWFRSFLLICRYVDYCMEMVNLLINNGVTPVLVFDGKDLPNKEATNKERAEYTEEWMVDL